MHQVSPAYFVAALLLNLLLALRVMRLYVQAARGQRIDKATALPVYKYSMLYLFLLFLAMSLDRIFFL